MGEWRAPKQSSIQFHIWKQCIKQRESDEMYFLIFISLVMIFLSTMINDSLGAQFFEQQDQFGS